MPIFCYKFVTSFIKLENRHEKEVKMSDQCVTELKKTFGTEKKKKKII